MALNPIQQAKDLLRIKRQELQNTTQSIGRSINNTFNKTVPVSPTGVKVYNTIQKVAAPIDNFARGGAAGTTFGVVSPPKIGTGALNSAAYTAGNVVGMLNPYSAGSKAMGGIGKAGGTLASGAALRTATKIAPRSLSIVKGVGGEIAQTLGYAGASKAGSGIGVNQQTDQFNPKNLAMNALAGIGIRGASSGNINSTVKNIFGRSKESAINLREIDSVIDMYKMGNKKQKAEAMELIRIAAERSAPQFARDKYVDDPLKLAREIQKNLSSKKPQFNQVSRLIEDTPQSKEVFNPKAYVDELTQKKSDLKGGQKVGITQKAKSFLADVKEKFVDSASPIEDVIDQAEKKFKFQVRPTADPRLQIDRIIKSNTLASQFAKDNGLEDVIKNAPDLDSLDQYLIAKQASKVSELGKVTGRDSVKDSQLVQALGSQYEQHAQKVTEYSKKLKDYMVETGLISGRLSKELDAKYPDYVPLNRVFTEMEKAGLLQPSTRPIASLSKQTVVQKLEGSEREIESPIESLLLKTQDAFNQGERNIAAKQLTSLRDMPGMEKLFKEVKDTQGKITISYLDGGVKRIFETTPEIEAAAKSLTQEQVGLIGNILRFPTRALQLGATGLNVPFVVTNMVKDEITGFINSNKAASTSLLNPTNYVKSLMSALKHDDLYDEVVRNAAGGTSFDIARLQPELSVQKLRADRKFTTSFTYKVTRPSELLRAVEDLVGRGEEVGRIKNYKGTYDALIKQGRTVADAKLLAAKAARNNTANFGRKGSWGRVLNAAIPFFNAGIQGSRQLMRSFQRDPVGTSAKMAISVFTPVAAATTWNLSDPTRKQVYQDLSPSEKENNIVIIPPNPTQNKLGQWNVIKIPIPPGISNLSGVVRKTLEGANGLDPVKFQDIASALVAASTSIDPSDPRKAASSLVPQGLKLISEPLLNKNFFTGNDIVPQYMKSRPSEFQAYDDTSGTARGVGRLLNTSPLKVENFIKTAGGGLGSQLLNVSDRALNAMGKIPEEQIGGEGPIANVKRRFTASYGGQTGRAAKNELSTYESYKSQVKKLVEAGQTDQAKQFVLQNKDVFMRGSEITSKGKAVEKLEDAKKKIQKSDLDPETKSRAINKLNLAIIQMGGAK